MFFLYCDIQTNDKHYGIMSKTDQYNNIFQHIWVLIYYYSTSLHCSLKMCVQH